MKPGILLLVYFLLSAVCALVVAPFAVRALRRLKAGQTVLGYVTQHEHKTGTPTMGGIIFLLPAVIVCAVETTAFSLVALAVTLGFAVLGFLDDFIKIKFHRNLGLKAYQKIIGQLGISAIAAYFCFASPEIGTSVMLPLGGGEGYMSWGIIPFVILVYVATTNSVNLTDGLDGLAATTSAGYFLVFAVLTFLMFSDAESVGDGARAEQLFSLSALSASLLGGLLGYLVFNANPASVMMGDTGSLGLGAAAATVAVFSRSELLLPVAGIMFVWSSISVIMQVLVFKTAKRRVFLMAPFHHHLEMKGWSETRICALYLVLTLIAGALTLILARAV